MRRPTTAGLVVLLLLGTCVPPVAAGVGESMAAARADAEADGETRAVRQDPTTDGETRAVRQDPPTDEIGWENGYWHDDPVDVDQSDGLSDAETEAYVARAMARVEYVRNQEFTQSVPVDVIARSEYRQGTSDDSSNASFGAWNNQVWEALFLVGEDADVQQKLGSTYGSSVSGFYSPSDDRIKIITDSPDEPTIDNATLVHELVHALQDQTRGFNGTAAVRETQDGSLAADAVVEGEANYVERRYTQRCGGEWTCVATPRGGSGDQSDPPHLGILLTLLHPYSDGPVYVDWLRERGGWDAVNDAFDDPPVSTEQVIHTTDERPVPVDFDDRARNGWKRFPKQGQNGSDTVGEASMYVMFWYQARVSNADAVSVGSISRTDGPLDLYNYDAEPSAGWANDRVFPYRKANGSTTDYGYVWVTEWDTERDARQFQQAYRAVLNANDAEQRGDGRYVVPSGAFADAFRVTRTGTRVTVVNGPTLAAVADIRPPGSDGEAGDGGTNAGSDGGASGVSAPGFGPLVALAALLAAAGLLSRRRR
ncbi:MAG: Hvo_1808 family surface protein [Haloferacaceae archaeon]